MSHLRNLVGERIRAVRKAKRLTQLQLAELSGLDDAYIGAVERGERNFTIDTLEKIHSALQVGPDELLRSSRSQSKEELIRQQAADEFVSMVSALKYDQIEVIIRINKELLHAFKHSQR
jgi:transcriptional regulator with XRE-family HTH domain